MSPAPPSPLPARDLRPLDPHIWTACAGSGTRIPTVGSTVYYFPQGHAEQATSPPDFSTLPHHHPYTLCSVSAVTLLANPDTDEVFAKIHLDPRLLPSPVQVQDAVPDDDHGVQSVTKILTPSDANNGGGFSVPKSCAVSILPPLDLTAPTPVQNITIRDVHGNVYKFRHIYRGSPRRHLFTTGWSKYVNEKKLVSGDSLVFIKNRAGDLFMGIRRAVRVCHSSLDYLPDKPTPLETGVKVEGGFSRKGRGRVKPEAVVEAARLAEMNAPFEVVYYPSAGAEFVVRREIVEAAMKVVWASGVRVKMPVETEDLSRMTMFHGSVSGKAVQDPILWPSSVWRMLQVTWDEPKALANVKSVNPWQVELTTTLFQAPYPALKKLKASPPLELPKDIQNTTPPVFSDNTFPAGMQGARHDLCYESNLPSLLSLNTHQLNSSNHNGFKMPERLADVSIEPFGTASMSSTSGSDILSPQSQSSSVQYHGSSSTQRIVSIRLFGQSICMEERTTF